MNIDELIAIHEIQTLKARYFRLMDTKQWEEFRDVFTDDFRMYVETGVLPEATEPTFTSPDHLLTHLRSAKPGKITIHQGHMPEIEVTDGEHATGIWAMFDWVDDPGRGGAWQGYGHYRERYLRCPDGKWRIDEGRLTRLRLYDVDPMPDDVRWRVAPIPGAGGS